MTFLIPQILICYKENSSKIIIFYWKNLYFFLLRALSLLLLTAYLRRKSFYWIVHPIKMYFIEVSHSKRDIAYTRSFSSIFYLYFLFFYSSFYPSIPVLEEILFVKRCKILIYFVHYYFIYLCHFHFKINNNVYFIEYSFFIPLWG